MLVHLTSSRPLWLSVIRAPDGYTTHIGAEYRFTLWGSSSHIDWSNGFTFFCNKLVIICKLTHTFLFIIFLPETAVILIFFITCLFILFIFTVIVWDIFFLVWSYILTLQISSENFICVRFIDILYFKHFQSRPQFCYELL